MKLKYVLYVCVIRQYIISHCSSIYLYCMSSDQIILQLYCIRLCWISLNYIVPQCIISYRNVLCHIVAYYTVQNLFLFFHVWTDCFKMFCILINCIAVHHPKVNCNILIYIILSFYLYYNILHCILMCYIIPDSMESYCIVSCCMMLHCVVSHCITLISRLIFSHTLNLLLYWYIVL